MRDIGVPIVVLAPVQRAGRRFESVPSDVGCVKGRVFVGCEGHRLPMMLQHDITTFVERWQADDQSPEHAGDFLSAVNSEREQPTASNLILTLGVVQTSRLPHISASCEARHAH